MKEKVSKGENLEKQRKAIDGFSLLNRMAIEEVDNAFKNVPEPKFINAFYLLYPYASTDVPLLEEVQEYLRRLDDFRIDIKAKLEFLHFLKKDYQQRATLLRQINPDKINLKTNSLTNDFVSEFILSVNNTFNFLMSMNKTKSEFEFYDKNYRRPFFKQELNETLESIDTFIKLVDDEINFFKNTSLSLQDKNTIPEIINLEPERIIWNGTKQDLVALFDTLIQLGLIIPTKNKDQLLGKHFSLFDANKISEIGELKHTRKLLREGFAKPTEKMDTIIKKLKSD
ncbi:MAG: hypothetical protein B6D44_04305 [Ignavibacteriales bacterium UTCHB2]|jgi:hypothetical protein|nr:MAG: hypothetical protein B6D44_04305 [Ignavibacteriales bacterium UTCHB2]